MHTEAENAIIATQIAALQKMLLKGRALAGGLTILGGKRQDPWERVKIGRLAAESGEDMLHVGFEHTAKGFEMTELMVALKRDQITYVAPECRLWSDRSGSRVVLVPPAPRFKGTFGFLPDEIVHLRSRPRDLEMGFARADAMLRSRCDAGPCIPEGCAFVDI